jgi:preprotein translocase subunit YajC
VQYLPLIIVAVVVIIGLVVSRRAKQRSADLAARMQRDIEVGSQVMTTSGLYGTVVALNSDDTVILAIAPGVEVRWAFAALRGADSLPPRYRRGPTPDPAGTGSSPTAVQSPFPPQNQPVRTDVSDDS